MIKYNTNILNIWLDDKILNQGDDLRRMLVVTKKQKCEKTPQEKKLSNLQDETSKMRDN